MTNKKMMTNKSNKTDQSQDILILIELFAACS